MHRTCLAQAINLEVMSDVINNILKRNQLSVTDSRKKILEFFQHAGGALAHADIEKLSGDNFDRVTIYRTLQTFVDKGIIHTIPTADNSVKYALCKDECEAGHHHDNHIHFLCDDCGTTYCLESNIPTVDLPKGFVVKRTDVVVSGRCGKCSN
jgi:Fur family transcriptional regulator, ferric uptake regulator